MSLPLRPLPLLRHTPSPWPCIASPRRTSPRQAFSTSRPLSAEPNHYETLGLASTADASEIKRQFYALSKKHHPDRNPSDPTASTRFVAISEAYHTLSVPEKRSQYDAQLAQSSRTSRWGGASAYPSGSHSSAAYGSRPASGLNKKRTTFRGPPPSFYKSGGYGQHGTKRSEYAHHDVRGGEKQSGAHAHDDQEAGSSSYGDWGGFGPGQQQQGHEVPHFDDRRHKETHESLNEHIYARRRKNRVHRAEEEHQGRGSMVANFLMVTGTIGFIGFVGNLLGKRNERVATKDGP